MTTILESCHVSPPPDTTSELTLPLTFLDLSWLHFSPIRRLMFYHFPSSKQHFLDTIVPTLKHSLSLTLKHYVPLAANLLYPVNIDENRPLIRYLPGDYVPLTISESDKDFGYLTAYHARGSHEFYDFVPRRPPIKEEEEEQETKYKSVPILALQVTLFPNRGFCIGVSNLHVVGDANSIFAFLKAWSSTNKLGGNENIKSLPSFDKSLIKDPLGMEDIFWNDMKRIPYQEENFSIPMERVRATFVLEPVQIKKLKDIVLSKNPGLGHVSSFVVGISYAWTCFVKSGEEFEQDEFFYFAIDIRARVIPAVPNNYFGNCLAFGLAKMGRKELVGEEGFLLAASALSEDIKKRVNKKDELLKGAENWGSFFMKMMRSSKLTISGSPKFDLYGVDFGWGMSKKVEVMNIDSEKYCMSLNKSRDFEGGLEFGFSMSKERMEKFVLLFDEGFKFL